MKSRLYLLSIVLLLLSSCQKRYWYRSFVFGSSKNLVPVNLIIQNESPTLLTETFEKEMRAACEKQLLKKGYKVVPKKATFQFKLVIKVDKFTVNGLAHYGGERTMLYPYFDKEVKAILFECILTQSKKDLNWTVWENTNDLYFFGKQKRDMRRSRGMVKYLIRSAKQK
ncbi:MAG: hypothetical protein ACEQSR_02425 [Candidatus Methylacidiphilales bacterium]